MLSALVVFLFFTNGTNDKKRLYLYCSGVIAGAKITEYLLEKSRIVTHAADERNYHVFYEMLKGLKPDEKERYGLTAAENYFYLNQARIFSFSNCITIIIIKTNKLNE